MTEWRVYLEDPGLLFEVLILIGLSVRKVVNLDTMFIDLIQNLSKKVTKHSYSHFITRYLHTVNDNLFSRTYTSRKTKFLLFEITFD